MKIVLILSVDEFQLLSQAFGLAVGASYKDKPTELSEKLDKLFLKLKEQAAKSPDP
jgi:hypothetical protein